MTTRTRARGWGRLSAIAGVVSPWVAAADHPQPPPRPLLGPVEWVLAVGAVLALLLAAWALLAPSRREPPQPPRERPSS